MAVTGLHNTVGFPSLRAKRGKGEGREGCNLQKGLRMSTVKPEGRKRGSNKASSCNERERQKKKVALYYAGRMIALKRGAGEKGLGKTKIEFEFFHGTTDLGSEGSG